MPVDQYNKIKMTTVHHKALATAAAALGSTAVSMKGLRSLTFVISKTACTATTGTFIIDMESGTASATTGHTSATTSEVIGSNVRTLTATTVESMKIGYIGADPFVSLSITAGAATGSICAIAIQEQDMKQPTATS